MHRFMGRFHVRLQTTGPVRRHSTGPVCRTPWTPRGGRATGLEAFGTGGGAGKPLGSDFRGAHGNGGAAAEPAV